MNDWRKDVNAKLEAGMAGGGRWLVGVSGGGDSVALLRMLVAVGYSKRIVVGYFNHHWSAWGDEAQAFVEHLAKAHKLPIVVGNGGGKAATNAEGIARDERRAWFLRICNEMGVSGVILAHTRTDMVEGFLMRAGKGSGVRGLAGMREMVGKEVKVWRPLLSVGREDLRGYLDGLGQEWLEDPDNARGGSQRARIRKVLPALADAGVGEEAMLASIAALRRADDALEAVVGRWMTEHCLPVKGGVSVPRDAWVELPEELALKVMARIQADFIDDEMVPRTGKRQDLLRRIADKEKDTATLGGCKFIWDGASVRVEKEEARK